MKALVSFFYFLSCSKKNLRLISLVDGEQGLHDALNAGAKEITVFIAATDTYTKEITQCTIKKRLKDLTQIIALAKERNIYVRGAISVALGCPYEGYVDPVNVAKIAQSLWASGSDEVILGDSVGLGTPPQVEKLIGECIAHKIPINKIGLHFHNTYGMALVNLYTGLQMGISIIESSVGGLGGRSNIPGAGNIATEDLTYMLNALQIETNINLDQIITVGKFACDYLNMPIDSKVSKAK